MLRNRIAKKTNQKEYRVEKVIKRIFKSKEDKLDVDILVPVPTD